MEVQLNKILLASVSHEYRTPLNAMKQCADGIKRNLIQEKDSKRREENMWMLDIILVSVELMLSLIDDLLDNSKIERNNFIIQNSEFLINDLISEVKSLFEIQAKGKGLNLHHEIVTI